MIQDLGNTEYDSRSTRYGNNNKDDCLPHYKLFVAKWGAVDSRDALKQVVTGLSITEWWLRLHSDDIAGRRKFH